MEDLVIQALLVMAALFAVVGLSALTIWGFVWCFKKLMGWK